VSSTLTSGISQHEKHFRARGAATCPGTFASGDNFGDKPVSERSGGPSCPARLVRKRHDPVDVFEDLAPVPWVGRKKLTMNEKQHSRPKQAEHQPADTEFRFEIDAYTPETMPMARLAEYLSELASILGEPRSVHLVRLEAGSTVLVHRIEREAIPKVRHRANGVRRMDAPRDAIRAYRTINKLLREDNGIAVLQEEGVSPILRFPGREDVEETYEAVRQEGSIDGFVMRVGGLGADIPVLLEAEGQQIAGCFADRATAKQLAQRLFDPVRLYGRGTWMRDADGVWGLKSFRISSFDSLDDRKLTDVVASVRTAPGGWDESAYDEITGLRDDVLDGEEPDGGS